MASSLMQNVFSHSAKNSVRNSLVTDEQDSQRISFVRLSNRTNIQSTLVLPSIEKNFVHKKLGSDSKTTKVQDQYNVKEALKEWLIGKSDITIETIIKGKQQQSNREIESPNTNDTTQSPVVFMAKRRHNRSKRFSQEEIGSQSTLDTSNNHNNFDQNSYSISGSSQSIQLPKVLENTNQLSMNNESTQSIRLNNRIIRHSVKKPSIDIFDDSNASNTAPITQSSNIYNKKESQQENNQNQQDNIFNRSSFKAKFFDNNPMSYQRQLKNNSQIILNDATTPIKFGSDTKIQISPFQQQSYQSQQQSPTGPRYSSLQHIPQSLNVQNEILSQRVKYDQQPTFDSLSNINDSHFSVNQSRVSLNSRNGGRKYVCSSMNSIAFPENQKENRTKSILKCSSRSVKTLPPISKKNVIFNEKVIQYSI